MHRMKNIVYNGCIALNAFLIFLAISGTAVEVPVWLQVGGRLHPMLVHFPITLVLMVAFWESFFSKITINEKTTIGDGLLLATAMLAAITALMGILLSQESGYDRVVISLHQWMGISVAVTATVWYAFRNQFRKNNWLSRSISVMLLILLMLAGHEGAIITHGENFVFEPVQTETKEKVLLDDAFIYAHVVQPLLDQKCYGCHNSKKAKGGLVMDPVQNLIKGGDHGILWDSLDSELGLLMHHLNLPMEDDKHMPPKGKPQLSENERRLLYYWIKAGPDFENKVIELPDADTLRVIASSFLHTIEEDVYAFVPADDERIAALNSDYRLVVPVARQSPALRVEFFGSSFFKREQLEELRQVRDQIISLNLNRMPVQDRDLKIIGEFKNLRKLNLSGTEITGETLADLHTLKELRQLVMTGTSIDFEALKKLSPLDKLAALFIWNTQLTKEDIEELRRQWPSIRIESGFQGDTLVAKLSPPQLMDGEEIFTTNTNLTLKHFVNGVEIRYTLDGTNPDSIHAAVYDGKDILISSSLQIRARAYLKGWIASDVMSKNFYKAGYRPDSIRLINVPNPDYKGGGGSTLFDSRKGTTNFRTAQWLGFREQPIKMELLFNEPVSVSVVTLSCLVDLNSYIFPGAQFEVWSEDDTGAPHLLAELFPDQPTSLAPAMLTSFILTFKPILARKILIVGKPVGRLPNWHPGRGDKGWIFIDEIFLN